VLKLNPKEELGILMRDREIQRGISSVDRTYLKLSRRAISPTMQIKVTEEKVLHNL
jgi:hypothetical protein